jgi:hypothetical protein
MEILFASSELEAAALSEDALAEIFGTSARKACQRLYELAAANDLAVAAALPMLQLCRQPRCARFTVGVPPKHQITLEPVLRSRGKNAGQEIDLASVTTIRILAFGGSHDS